MRKKAVVRGVSGSFVDKSPLFSDLWVVGHFVTPTAGGVYQRATHF